MTTIQLVLLLIGVGAALGLAAYTYYRREPRSRGRALLVALRTLSISLIILLLLDPQLTAQGPRASGRTRVILDASLSMLLGPSGNSAWQRAVAAAKQAAAGQPVLLAGQGVQSVSVDSLDRLAPYAGESRMLEALQSAAEAGAERVVLITDGSIDDLDEVVRWLPTLDVTVDVRSVAPASAANRAIRSVEAPAWAEAGKPLQLTARIAANGMTGRAAVVVRQNANQLARAEVDLPPEGDVSVPLSFTANGPAQGGLVRYDVALEAADAIPDDDARSVYVFISEKPAGVALVSFEPDWEPRFLHPVLQNALGLPVRTFLRVPAGHYFRGGTGSDAGTRADEAVVRRAVEQADLLVLHGFGIRSPEWAQQAARNARRVMIFPARDGIQIPFPAAPSIEADWYVSAELPASPIASLLAGIDAGELPPLNSLHPTDPPAGSWAPLLGGRARRGGSAPLVLAHERAGRRAVLALGSGYWRWAFRGGPSRDAYTRLWAALGGWVVQEQAQVAASAIRPVERAVARATPIRWVAPGIAADSFVLMLNDAVGNASRLRMTFGHADTVTAASPRPGHYTYDVQAYGGGQEIARSRGPLTVETYSPEFLRRNMDLSRLTKAPRSLARTTRTAGRPLHSFSWLYVVIVALLSAEWILRRRWGLR